MKPQPERITFKEFLKILRLGLRPSLAKKEFERFLRSMKKYDIFNEFEMQGKSLEARARVLPILDTPEYVKVEKLAGTDGSKTDADGSQVAGGNFWAWWDKRYGGHPSRASDYDALKSFWAHWGTSLEWVEAQSQQRARQDYESRVEEGFDMGSAGYLKAEYDKWRQTETLRQRANSARIKAAKAAAAKAEAERVRSEKKSARRNKPHFTGLADAEKELDRKAFANFQQGNFAD